MSVPEQSSIVWFRNETEELTASETLTIVNTEKTSVMKLINCKPQDSGTNYTVKIMNPLGESVSNKATLTVKSGPTFEVEPTDKAVLKEKEVKFECVVNGNPKPTVTWMLNGKEFGPRDPVKIENSKNKYSLTIQKVLKTVINIHN